MRRVVEALDIIEHIGPCLIPRPICLSRDAFGFQRREEAFHRRLAALIRRVLDLPPETRLFTGHDYPPALRAEPAWEASVAQHRHFNVHVRDGISEAEFAAMRTKRDATLDAPALILPALQVNIRAGEMPPPSIGGHIYLRLPVNAI